MTEPDESGRHAAHRRQVWKDSTAAVALDVISKIFVVVGTPIIGWVLLQVVDHGQRINVVETRISEGVNANNARWTAADNSLMRIEVKVDRLIERNNGAKP